MQILWDAEDGFFYDAVHLPNDKIVSLKVRSLVGLLPLLAVETLEANEMEKLSTFSRRVDWFVSKRAHVFANLNCVYRPGVENRRLLAILTEERLISILKYMLDENEFLSEFGIRSLSKHHKEHPFSLHLEGEAYGLGYCPGEADSGLFGGNSNWRGPIWLPINFLIIESLQKFYHYYGDSLKVEFPTRSGKFLNLAEVSAELSQRLIKLFQKDEKGGRPINGASEKYRNDPHWKDLLLFPEYFHGDSGLGLGADHQTGWTALIAKLIQSLGVI